MPERPNKVIIFDWDDTICPSSFVDQWKVENVKDLPLYFQNLFHEVGKCAEKCLDAAAKHAEVIIITNSDDGWVRFSADRFVPNLLPCLDRYRIISARTRYERFYPNQPLCWKAAAFAHEVNEIYSSNCNSNGKERTWDPSENDVASLVSTEDYNSSASTSLSSLTDDFASIVPSKKKFNKLEAKSYTKNFRLTRKEVISFGDSMEEHTAVKIVANQLQATPKSVMFINSPSPIQLIGQLTMVTENMDFVCEQENMLDLEISARQAVKAAEDFLANQSSHTPGHVAMKTSYNTDRKSVV